MEKEIPIGNHHYLETILVLGSLFGSIRKILTSPIALRGYLGGEIDLGLFDKIRSISGRMYYLFGLYGFLYRLSLLGGGNSNIFYFHPEPWGHDPI